MRYRATFLNEAHVSLNQIVSFFYQIENNILDRKLFMFLLILLTYFESMYHLKVYLPKKDAHYMNGHSDF